MSWALIGLCLAAAFAPLSGQQQKTAIPTPKSIGPPKASKPPNKNLARLEASEKIYKQIRENLDHVRLHLTTVGKVSRTESTPIGAMGPRASVSYAASATRILQNGCEFTVRFEQNYTATIDGKKKSDQIVNDLELTLTDQNYGDWLIKPYDPFDEYRGEVFKSAPKTETEIFFLVLMAFSEQVSNKKWINGAPQKIQNVGAIMIGPFHSEAQADVIRARLNGIVRLCDVECGQFRNCFGPAH